MRHKPAMKSGLLMGPDAYVQRKAGISVSPLYEAFMVVLWARSSVMALGDYDPPEDVKGNRPRWLDYCRKTVKADVRTERLTPIEGKLLIEYLEILGT